MSPDQQPANGTLAYRNWIAALEEKPSRGAVECPLYTDALIVGQVKEGLGPFQLINTIAGDSPTSVPAVVLRYEQHLSTDLSDWFGPGNKHYHGGYISDEVAALASLSLGIRLKSGAPSREFDVDGDLRGRPIAPTTPWNSEPVLVGHGGKPIIPSLMGKRNIINVDLLRVLPKLDSDGSIALVRTARLYQDAVWMSDAEPQLSWLLLVSAVETSANHWRSEQEEPIERLRASRPQLEAVLVDAGCEGLLDTVAEMMAPYMGATNKFIKFLTQHCPAPPDHRSPEWQALEWTKKNLKAAFNTIYDLRSRALHGGQPFPYPMCVAPKKFEDAYSEVPSISGAMGAEWTQDETPMLLHTFERIVREALLSYWSGVVLAEEDT